MDQDRQSVPALVKIILILFFSGLFSKNEDKLNSFQFIMLSLALLAVPLFLIYKEPDLSTTVVTALTFCAILFIPGLSYKIIGGILLMTVPVIVIFFSIIMQPGQTLLKDYQLERIMAWLRPAEYIDSAYQQKNSIIAIGSGQLYGKGLNNNMVSSVKGGNFIAEPQTDFIFAVAGEELGFLGCCLIVVLELLIVVECIRIARRCRDLALLRYGVPHYDAELYEYFSCHRTDAKYRHHAPVRQLWRVLHP